MTSLLAVVFAAGAWADGSVPNARLNYGVELGVAGCPDVRQVRDAVAARLGRVPFDDVAPLQIDVHVSKAGGGLRGVVVVQRPDGTTGRRALESAAGDCVELAASLELAISLIIDPAALDAPPTPAPPPQVVAPPAPPPPPPPLPSDPWGVGLQAGVVGAAGHMPGVTVGLEIGASMAWRRLLLMVDGRVHLPTSVTFSGGTVSTLVAEGSALPCARLGVVGLCGMVTVGLMQVAGATARDTREVVPLVLLGLHVEGTFSVSESLALVAFAEGRVVATQVRLASGGTFLWSTWPVAPSLGLLVRWSFR